MLGRSAVGLLTLSAGNYAAIAISTLVTVVLSRTMGSEEFGRLALLIIAAQSLDLAVSNWTLPVLVRSGAQEWATSSSVADALWARTLVVLPPLILAAAAVLLFAAPLTAYLAVGPGGLALVFGFFLATGLAQTAGAMLRATNRMARHGAALVIEKAALLGLIAAAPLILPMRAEIALSCYAAAALLAAVWSFAQLGLRVLRPVRVGAARLREVASFSAPLIVGSWAGLFGNQAIDYVVIRSFLPFAELGRYAIAYQIAGLLQQILIVISAFLLPKFSALLARGREGELRDVVGRLTPYLLLAFNTAAAVGIIVAPLVVPLAFGADFAGAIAPLGVLLLTAGLASIFSVLSPLLVAHGVVWPVTRGVILAVTLNVIFDLVLIPIYGLLGAALATLIAYCVTTAFTLAAVHERLKMASFRYVLFVLPVAAVELCALLVEGPLFIVIGGGLLVATTAMLVRIFRLFRREDRELLARVRSW